MKGTLQKYNTEVVPLADEGINDIEIYFDCLRTLHTQAVTEAISNYSPNRVLGTPPPDISPLESFLTRPVCTTLAQLRSGHCRLLKSYKARITTGVYMSRVWSGTTLCRLPVQLLCSSNSTYGTGSLGQPGGGSRLPKPG